MRYNRKKKGIIAVTDSKRALDRSTLTTSPLCLLNHKKKFSKGTIVCWV